MGGPVDDNQASLPMGALEALPTTGKRRGDFTYRLFEKIDLSDQSLEHSLWTGAVLRKCRFTRVNFRRSDFAGTRFVDCDFEECDFEPDEFRSCFLTRVRFSRCLLVGLQCVGTQFEDCQFIHCDMRRSVVRECQFQECDFDQAKFEGSSITLNRYERCDFKGVVFGDATVAFLIFRECAFAKCAMNAETIGYTFGLTLKNIQDFDLIYLGLPQEKPEDRAILSALIETYRLRHWILGVALLEIGFDLAPTYVALRGFARSLAHDVALEPRLDWDELLFLCFVLEELAEDKSLPFLAVWELEATIARAIRSVELAQPRFRDLTPSANHVLWRLQKTTQRRMTEFLEDGLFEIDPIPAEVTLHLALSERPRASLTELIPPEHFAIVGARPSGLRLISASSGSWNEIWQSGFATLVAVKLTLVLVDTTWERAAKLWKRTTSAGKTLRKRKVSGKAVANTSRAVRLQATGAPDLPTVAAAVERAAAELRVVTEADREALLRLDVAIRRLSLLSDENINRLMEYAGPNLQRARIERSSSLGGSTL